MDADPPESAVPKLGGMLTADELLRASGIRAEDARRRFVASRAGLRALLGHYLDRTPDDIALATTTHGKPRLADATEPLRFNLSHSGAIALIAVAHHREVGADVEHIRPRTDLPGLARRIFTAAERETVNAAHDADAAFYRHWVAKEAFVKATGRGVASLRSLEVLLEAPGGARLVHVGGDTAEAERWTLTPLDPAPGYAGAVVVEGAASVGQPKPFDPLAKAP